MRVVCGLVRPSEGEVEVGGRLLWTNASFPESVGLLIEAPALLDLYPAMDNLRMLASIKGVAGEEDLRRAIERVGLLPDDHRRVGKYSLGMPIKNVERFERLPKVNLSATAVIKSADAIVAKIKSQLG